MKEELSQLSSQLRSLHKDLLQHQARNAEMVDERKYSPYDILHLAIHDSRFEWLRKLSSLMAQIDHRVHSEEEIEILDVQSIFDEATRLFNNEYPEFSEHYNLVLSLDPHLTMKQASVLTALKKLQPFVRDMHEMHTENEKNKFKEI